MKTFLSKSNHSANASAIQQALLASAIENNSTCNSGGEMPAPSCKAPNPIKLPEWDSLPDSGFVRLPSLLLLFACSRATIWRWVKANKIPAPKKLGPRLVAWNVGEIRLVLSAFMKGEAA
jgi:predicted DNA-binding transcriptional regulator AlpA